MSGWVQDRKVVVRASVTYEPAHFSRICYCNIPPCWTVEAQNVEELAVPIGEGSHYHLYAHGETRKDAVANFVATVKRIFPQGGTVTFV